MVVHNESLGPKDIEALVRTICEVDSKSCEGNLVVYIICCNGKYNMCIVKRA